MRLGHPLSRTSVRSTGARVRAHLHPPNAPPPPGPPDLLYCLQTQPPASSPATRGLLPGPPVFHPGPRSTRAARRRVPGDGRADGGSDLSPSRDLGPRARPPSETDSARAPQGLPSPLARVGPGLAPPPPPRARSSSKGGKKKGGKNRKRPRLQQRSAAVLGQAGRRTRKPAIQGRGGGHPGRVGFKKKVAAAAAATQGRRPEGRVQRAGGGCAASRSLEPPGAGRRASGRRRLLEQRRRRRRRRHLLLT
ncbi:unnamed protein product [Rangifer tarandus platyrhynchus]|uniref:Uncharacterized protein n=2 Tax=Rangifer tarandus platyrhynchus TaxID=3082113 RepID=A0ABN8YMF1_RANTA|nr:unnamed protein product [Rangifer tarandus platyrhynchus]CAI9697292.1 unnamed protein product [Rangifer tarandus platyrhynchus]